MTTTGAVGGAEGRLKIRIMEHGGDVEVVGGLQGRHVRLTIPAKAEYVALCRLMIAALGSRSSLGLETVADLKVAVTEACSMMVVSGEQPGVSTGEAAAIDIEIELQPDSWIIAVTGPALVPQGDSQAPPETGPADGGSAETGPADLGLVVIESLVDSVEYGPNKGGRFFRMVKRLT